MRTLIIALVALALVAAIVGCGDKEAAKGGESSAAAPEIAQKTDEVAPPIEPESEPGSEGAADEPESAEAKQKSAVDREARPEPTDQQPYLGRFMAKLTDEQVSAVKETGAELPVMILVIEDERQWSIYLSTSVDGEESSLDAAGTYEETAGGDKLELSVLESGGMVAPPDAPKAIVEILDGGNRLLFDGTLTFVRE